MQSAEALDLASKQAFNFAGTSGTTCAGLSGTIENTTYVQSSANIVEAGLTTFASTIPATPLGTNGGPQTVTVYPAFGSKSSIGQGHKVRPSFTKEYMTHLALLTNSWL